MNDNEFYQSDMAAEMKFIELVVSIFARRTITIQQLSELRDFVLDKNYSAYRRSAVLPVVYNYLRIEMFPSMKNLSSETFLKSLSQNVPNYLKDMSRFDYLVKSAWAFHRRMQS